MSVTTYKCIPLERSMVVKFIETYHYSHSVNGVIGDYCFGLYDKDKLIGAAMFGRMAMVNQWKRFTDSPDKVIELRRLCCVDETPKNTESFFIGKMLRWMARNTSYEMIVSYADAQHNHTGTIYRASNFEYLGKSKGSKVIIHKGKSYHDKAIRTTYKGRLKPFAQRLIDALANGDAKYMETAGKHTFLYRLRK